MLSVPAVNVTGGKLVRANDDPVRTCAHSRCSIEGVRHTILDGLSERLGFKDRGACGQLVGQVLMPLFAQAGRRGGEAAALVLGPGLRNQQAGFDSLAQAACYIASESLSNSPDF